MSKKVKYVSDNTLRYFLQKIKALISGKADKTLATNYANGLMSKEDYSKLHNLKKSDISDFPSSMPASDVYSWAKQVNKPTYTWNEIGNRPTTMPPTSHSHDDRYYTEAEINSKLNGKADSGHKHSSSDVTISQSTINAYQSMGMS